MKRILAVVIMICLVLSLAGCGGSPASELENNDKTAAEQSEKPAEGSGSDSANTGSSIAWDPEKMGGMPQPEGVTVFMEMDLSETLGQDFAYSYSVTGLTKEVYQEYIKLASDTFPKVMEDTLSDKEGTFVATTEDHGQQFQVRFIEGNVSYIQYIK